MDTVTKAVRSQIMATVLAKDTKPEILVRKFLFASGFRYRKNVKTLQGKPDIVLPKYKSLVFVHGCFWHGHQHCDASRLPKTNVEYWTNKIAKNIDRDALNISSLQKAGWNVLIVWECELKNKAATDKRLKRLVREINKSKRA